MIELKTNKSLFHPIESTEGKNNHKRLYKLEKDGSITERIFLSIDDPFEREHIIFLHYLRFIAKHFFTNKIGVNIISRDNPWDFKLELNTGKTFNLEITSIADNPEHFKINKDQERFNQCYTKENISLREVIKLNTIFYDKDIDILLKEYKGKNLLLESRIPNPYYKKQIIPLSMLPVPTITLQEQIQSIISKKLQKNHNEKNNTVIIIDNRTSAYDLPDYYNAVKELSLFIETLPFSEIWFYTGFYSDNDGNNADFMFSPIKTTNKQNKILQKLSKKANVNSEIIW